jgi:hypothetical protein
LTPTQSAFAMSTAVLGGLMLFTLVMASPPPPATGAMAIPPLAKADRLSVAVPYSHPVRTIRIAATPPPEPVPFADRAPADWWPPPPPDDPDPELKAAPRHHDRRNICARTGGQKVETRSGRSWRCVYPGKRRS